MNDDIRVEILIRFARRRTTTMREMEDVITTVYRGSIGFTKAHVTQVLSALSLRRKTMLLEHLWKERERTCETKDDTIAIHRLRSLLSPDVVDNVFQTYGIRDKKLVLNILNVLGSEAGTQDGREDLLEGLFEDHIPNSIILKSVIKAGVSQEALDRAGEECLLLDWENEDDDYDDYDDNDFIDVVMVLKEYGACIPDMVRERLWMS